MADNKIRVKQVDQADFSGFMGGVFANTPSGRNADLKPMQSGVYDLGSTDKPWETVHTNSIVLSGSNDEVDRLYPASGNLLPIESGKYDLGSADKPWQGIHLTGGYKLEMDKDGVMATVSPLGARSRIKLGPQGNRGGFGGDSTLYYYHHQTGAADSTRKVATQVYPDIGHFTFDTPYGFNDASNVYISTSGYYSETGKLNLIDNEQWINGLVSSSSETRGTLRLFEKDNPSNFSSYKITGALTPSISGYTKVPLTFVNSSVGDDSLHTILLAWQSGDGVVLSFSAKGDRGQIGPQGPGVGATGPKGDGGPQGPQGSLGPQGAYGGPQGPRGSSLRWSGVWSSAFNYSGLSLVSHGNSSYVSIVGTGTNKGNEPLGTAGDLYWDVVASGVTGPLGPQGPEGGPPGVTGPTGTQGSQGAQGPAGAIGVISGSTNAIKNTIQQNNFWVGENAFGVIDVIRFNGSEYVKARANSEKNSEVVGVVESLDTGNNSFTVVNEGYVAWPTGTISNSPWGAATSKSEFSAGCVYWLDDVNNGILTTGEPNAIGSISKPVFYATSISGGLVQNYRGQVIDSGIGPNFVVPGIGDVTRNAAQTLTSKKLSLETTYDSSALDWNNGNVNVDLNGKPIQTLEILGNTSIKTINNGIGKTITLKIKNTQNVGYSLVFGDSSDKPVFVGSLPPTFIYAGKTALLSFTSFGSNQSDTIATYAEEK